MVGFYTRIDFSLKSLSFNYKSATEEGKCEKNSAWDDTQWYCIGNIFYIGTPRILFNHILYFFKLFYDYMFFVLLKFYSVCVLFLYSLYGTWKV